MSPREELLRQYEGRLRFPDSTAEDGVRLLELRSSLAVWEPELSDAEQARLADADEMLLRHAARLLEIAGASGLLEARRRAFRPPATHWWWQLERLAG